MSGSSSEDRIRLKFECQPKKAADGEAYWRLRIEPRKSDDEQPFVFADPDPAPGTRKRKTVGRPLGDQRRIERLGVTRTLQHYSILLRLARARDEEQRTNSECWVSQDEIGRLYRWQGLGNKEGDKGRSLESRINTFINNLSSPFATEKRGAKYRFVPAIKVVIEGDAKDIDEWLHSIPPDSDPGGGDAQRGPVRHRDMQPLLGWERVGTDESRSTTFSRRINEIPPQYLRKDIAGKIEGSFASDVGVSILPEGEGSGDSPNRQAQLQPRLLGKAKTLMATAMIALAGIGIWLAKRFSTNSPLKPRSRPQLWAIALLALFLALGIAAPSLYHSKVKRPDPRKGNVPVGARCSDAMAKLDPNLPTSATAASDLMDSASAQEREACFLRQMEPNNERHDKIEGIAFAALLMRRELSGDHFWDVAPLYLHMMRRLVAGFYFSSWKRRDRSRPVELDIATLKSFSAEISRLDRWAEVIPIPSEGGYHDGEGWHPSVKPPYYDPVALVGQLMMWATVRDALEGEHVGRLRLAALTYLSVESWATAYADSYKVGFPPDYYGDERVGSRFCTTHDDCADAFEDLGFRGTGLERLDNMERGGIRPFCLLPVPTGFPERNGVCAIRCPRCSHIPRSFGFLPLVSPYD